MQPMPCVASGIHTGLVTEPPTPPQPPYPPQSPQQPWPPQQPQYVYVVKQPMAGGAVAALVCGLVGLLPCLWGAPSIVALILGISALRQIKRDPRLRGRGQATAGVVLSVPGVIIAVMTVLGGMGNWIAGN